MVIYAQDVAANLLRWWWRLRREPVTLAVEVAQPVLWLLLFGHLFTYATVGFGLHVSYFAFMTPGVIVMTMVNVALAGGLDVLVDRESGMLRRLMVTPMHRSSLLVGRFLFVVLLGLGQVVVILTAGSLMGIIPRSGSSLAVVFASDILVGAGISILSLVLALRLKSHGPFYTIIGFVSLPLTFLSTALAPLGTMSGWLRSLAAWNPLTYAVDAVRASMLTHAGWPAVLPLLGYLALFDALCLVLGVAAFRKALL